MQVWTIQPLAVWQMLQTTGVLRTEPALIDPAFLPAYQWLVVQMQSRIGPPPPGCHFPLWLWYQWQDAEKRRPDLRAGGHLSKGQHGVLLTLTIPENAVLLSDFDLWHYVLNYWYLPQSVAEGDAFTAELTAAGLDFYRTKPLPDPAYHRRIEASWQRIFDLDWSAPEIASSQAEKQIQGVTWEITLAQVKKVQAFVAQ